MWSGLYRLYGQGCTCYVVRVVYDMWSGLYMLCGQACTGYAVRVVQAIRSGLYMLSVRVVQAMRSGSYRLCGQGCSEIVSSHFCLNLFWKTLRICHNINSGHILNKKSIIKNPKAKFFVVV